MSRRNGAIFRGLFAQADTAAGDTGRLMDRGHFTALNMAPETQFAAELRHNDDDDDG